MNDMKDKMNVPNQQFMKLLLSVLFSVITKGLLIGQMNVPQQAPADRISEKDNRVFITGL